MGRPPHGGGPVFRFTQNEVIEMEACLLGVNNAIPAREMICALAEKFSASADRAGKTVVQPKQVWNWFQNRRYSQRTKVKTPGKLNVPPMPRDISAQCRNPSHPVSVPQEQNSFKSTQLEFEAKSARDGAWYDVSAFLSHRAVETDNPEVRVRFSGFGVEEDEWINVLRNVRQRSLPCENAECISVLPGDLVLCFQEGKEQALYFDAHVFDAQRRRHDVRGCRCRFLVRYDHDQSEEIVPLRKVCRRPETDYRLQQLRASRASRSSGRRPSLQTGSSSDQNLIPQTIGKQRKLTDVNIDELTTIALPAIARTRDPATQQLDNLTAAIVNDNNKLPQDEPTKDPVLMTSNVYKLQQTMQVGEV